MFAIIKTGGKQYKVNTGDILLIEKLSVHQGDKIRFNQVLAIGDKTHKIGTPLVKGACVEAEILSQTKGIKKINFVKRRRKHSSQRKKGHRQDLTLVKVLNIKSDQNLPGKDLANIEIIEKSKSTKQIKKSSDSESVISGNGKKKEVTKEKKKSLQNNSANKDFQKKTAKNLEDKTSNKNNARTKVASKKKPKNIKKATDENESIKPSKAKS